MRPTSSLTLEDFKAACGSTSKEILDLAVLRLFGKSRFVSFSRLCKFLLSYAGDEDTLSPNLVTEPKATDRTRTSDKLFLTLVVKILKGNDREEVRQFLSQVFEGSQTITIEDLILKLFRDWRQSSENEQHQESPPQEEASRDHAAGAQFG